jgi:hypothetical protein
VQETLNYTGQETPYISRPNVIVLISMTRETYYSSDSVAKDLSTLGPSNPGPRAMSGPITPPTLRWSSVRLYVVVARSYLRVVHQREHLAEIGYGLLPKLLGVANVAVKNVLERFLHASLQLFLNFLRPDDDRATHGILRGLNLGIDIVGGQRPDVCRWSRLCRGSNLCGHHIGRLRVC